MTGKFWALLLYHGTFLPVLLPKKVVKPTHDAIAAAGLPVMASQENVQGWLSLYKAVLLLVVVIPD